MCCSILCIYIYYHDSVMTYIYIYTHYSKMTHMYIYVYMSQRQYSGLHALLKPLGLVRFLTEPVSDRKIKQQHALQLWPLGKNG